ncbi:hypothetical protein ONE63_010949 [Megalurothrips usitatus]|uniref:Fanconi Anaemia group E protein C-terminal domain-containing protein n=1 Tax=Megalurothrips usitatus TaxID=439358 RepID=A0AAV7XIM3_9NEOP|nr:hypothetical protein ONE63_010949 [Megalurothrips usitatus]
MAEDSRVWSCHPDLQAEWGKFVKESRKTDNRDLNSDLWMNFWRCETPTATAGSEPDAGDILQCSKALSQENSIDVNSMAAVSCEDIPAKSEVEALPLTDSQLEQVNSIALELLDFLDMGGENIPEDLKRELCSLSPPGMISLLKELRSQLSDQGAYSFCTLLCVDVDSGLWTDISIVFEFLFLPMLCGEDCKSLGEEVKAGLKLLAEHFPSACVSHLLRPLLSNETTSPSHLELLSELIPFLPDKDSLCLLRYYISNCTAPLAGNRISVLSCLVSGVRTGVLEMKTESPLLDLLPTLAASARELSASEPFASLLLKVINSFKALSSPQINSTLVAIVQQNNSFNKQALINAVKALG